MGINQRLQSVCPYSDLLMRMLPCKSRRWLQTKLGRQSRQGEMIFVERLISVVCISGELIHTQQHIVVVRYSSCLRPRWRTKKKYLIYQTTIMIWKMGFIDMKIRGLPLLLWKQKEIATVDWFLADPILFTINSPSTRVI